MGLNDYDPLNRIQNKRLIMKLRAARMKRGYPAWPHRTGDYPCGCGRMGIKHGKYNKCLTCFNAEKAIYNRKRYQDRRPAVLQRNEVKPDRWDARLSNQFAILSLRPGA